jgi:hypothetical protein
LILRALTIRDGSQQVRLDEERRTTKTGAKRQLVLHSNISLHRFAHNTLLVASLLAPALRFAPPRSLIAAWCRTVPRDWFNSRGGSV